jgi:DNA-cytosine methyltransferase
MLDLDIAPDEDHAAGSSSCITAPSTADRRRTFVSLFCGVGAFDMVLREMGLRCVLACDVDPSCKRVYRLNHDPHVPWTDDLFDLDRLPPHDVLVGGPPCIAFSSAGKRLGFEDPKNGRLVHRMLDLLGAMEVPPGIVVIENVYGLMTMQKGALLAFVVSRLEGLGYGVEVEQLRAQHYGAPMLRHRIFVVARKRRSAAAASSFFDRMPPAPMMRSDLRAIMSHGASGGPYTWIPRDKYVLLPRDRWVATEDNKVFCGYLTGRKLKGDPTMQSSHSQAARIYWMGGIYESFTQHRYPVFVGWPWGVRFLSDREMYSCMGFPSDFRISHYGTQARRHCVNSVNLFALRPLLGWAVHGERSKA